MSRQLEEILRDNFCEYRGVSSGIISRKEVPVFARSVDLVEYNVETEELTAIEFKIRDWKRALNQLKNVEICFDFLVLCIPKPKTEKCIVNIRDTCKEFGIGLYFWDIGNNTFSHECTETAQRDIWGVQKKHIIDYLSEMEDKNEQ